MRKKIRCFRKSNYQIITLDQAIKLSGTKKIYSFGIYKYDDDCHKGFQIKKYNVTNPTGSKKGVTIYAIKSDEIGKKLSEKDFPKYSLLSN